MDKVRVAVVGLGFGAAFAPIYRDHPDVELVGVCDQNAELAKRYAIEHGIARWHSSLDEVLDDSEYNAVHLVTPIPLHAEQSLEVLEAGKHCACTVPMATSVDDIRKLVAAERQSGLVYTMMETAVYTHHALMAKSMYDAGEFGTLQFLRGAHYQDMTGWPDYWLGLPPMHYATHAVAPPLAITGTRAISVRALGSGTMDERLVRRYGNPYPVETATFALDADYPLALEVTRSLFDTARPYVESFHLLGSEASFEWHMEHELPLLFRMSEAGGRGRDIRCERVAPPDSSGLLPGAIRHHSAHQLVADPDNPHQSLLQGSGHHGSHPHLVHEFVRSIVERRRSVVDSVRAAEWTAPGIVAHQSAIERRELLIPSFI